MSRVLARTFQGWFASFLFLNGYLLCQAIMNHDGVAVFLLTPGTLYTVKCFGDSGSLP